MSEKPNSYLIEGIGAEELSVQIYAVRINNKQMSAALFKQLPTVLLCDEKGDVRPNTFPWGVVRYETKEGNLWLLFKEEGILYKAALHPTQRSDESMQQTIDMWQRFRKNTADASEIERYQELVRVERLRKANEGKRSAAHKNAMQNPQLFIGV